MWEGNQVYSKSGFKAATVAIVTALRWVRMKKQLTAGMKGEDTPKLLEPFPAESLTHKPRRQV